MSEQQTGPSAKIITDSINEWGQRLVTMEVVMHRFVLAEMNTHRVFSRNSASSRAIPVHKMISKAKDEPAYPLYWGSEKKGMQSGDVLDPETIEQCKREWDYARIQAIETAERLVNLGLHKSLINRLLEPFIWHTAIISQTDIDNFFWQRCDPAAQPEMKAVADQMQLAYFSAGPSRRLGYGEWHLPYIQEQDIKDVLAANPGGAFMGLNNILKQISVARCARVSYLTQDGIRDFNEDVNLFNRLKGSGHWSPMEHVATPSQDKETWANFKGWRQFRREFSNENQTKFVPNLPELAQARMRIEAGLPR